MLVLSGVARLLYGLAPRLMVLAWLPLALAVVVMLFGDLWSIPQWVQDISPFEHLALVPAQQVDWAAVVGVGIVAVLLSGRPTGVPPPRPAVDLPPLGMAAAHNRFPGATRAR